MARRPRKQLEILTFLERELAQQGELPELPRVAKAFDISYPTLREHLESLAAKGYIAFESRGPGRSPRISLRRLTPSGIPLFGEIAAGLPVGAYPEPEGHLSLRGLEGGFALRVRGDSMAELIQEGDVVLLQQGEPQRSGEICAVRVGDNETTLKYLEWSGSPRRYLLRPHNPTYPTMRVEDPSALHVDGVFRSLLRGEVVEQLLVEGGDG